MGMNVHGCLETYTAIFCPVYGHMKKFCRCLNCKAMRGELGNNKPYKYRYIRKGEVNPSPSWGRTRITFDKDGNANIDIDENMPYLHDMGNLQEAYEFGKMTDLSNKALTITGNPELEDECDNCSGWDKSNCPCIDCVARREGKSDMALDSSVSKGTPFDDMDAVFERVQKGEELRVILEDERIYRSFVKIAINGTVGKHVSGQAQDAISGFVPLPEKKEKGRVIPQFPLSTYNFLKG